MRLENRKSPPCLASGLRPAVCPPASSLGHRERFETKRLSPSVLRARALEKFCVLGCSDGGYRVERSSICGMTGRREGRREPAAAAPGLASPRPWPRQSSFILCRLTPSLLASVFSVDGVTRRCFENEALRIRSAVYL